jgi:hypothetical protein
MAEDSSHILDCGSTDRRDRRDGIRSSFARFLLVDAMSLLTRSLILGAMLGILVLFLVFVGREVFCDWRRGRRIRKTCVNCPVLADEAVENHRIQCELDEALFEKGMKNYRKFNPSAHRRWVRSQMEIVK